MAEDHLVARVGVTTIVNMQPDMKVVAEASNGQQAVELYRKHQPDVALLDISLPGTDGITAAAELARLLPGCRVLILTGLESPGNVDAAMRAGVCGFLLKEGSAEDLIAAVRAVARGERVVDSRLLSPPPGQAEEPCS